MAVLPLHNLALRLSAGAGAAVPITNISTAGLGLLRAGMEQVPETGGRIEGALELEGRRLDTILRVAHVSPTVIGCAFEEPSADLKAAILRYFEVEISAVEMKEISPAFLKADPDGTPHWFRGRNNCELFFVTDSRDGLVRFSMAFFGNMVEGGLSEETRFGHVVDTVDEEAEFKPGYKASALVSWAPDPERDLSELARRFLKGVSGLDSRHLASILDRLRPSGAGGLAE